MSPRHFRVGFAAALLLLSLHPTVALGHGAPPVSEFIVKRGETLVVPTLYWGVFLGPQRGAGPWRWICEEAINMDQQRKWALCGDGTYHVTDYSGITTSRDGGCTWIAATGEIGRRATSSVVADPVDGKRAWAATNQGNDVPWNALFVTTDDGLTWTPALQGDEYFRGPAISRDGMAIYVAGVARGGSPPAVTLHASYDGGKSWSARQLINLGTSEIDPLAVDSKDATAVYLAVRSGATQSLAVARGAQFSTEFTLPAAIGEVVFDDAHDQVLVPVVPLGDKPLEAGLMRRQGAQGAWKAFSDLTRAQCVFPDGNTLYACSSNFAPDKKAIARSDDGGAHFTKVFNYDETAGPTLDCPPTTPVGQICPGIWDQYASQLGVGLKPAVDAGASVDAAVMVTTQPGTCSIGARRIGERMWWCAALLPVALALRIGRRRARDAAQRTGGNSAIPSG